MKTDASKVFSDNPSKYSVLIGMTESIDSFVAAYLLKKQGFNLKALAVINWSEGKLKYTKEITKDLQKEVQEKVIDSPRCHIKNIQVIEKFCESLNIPLFLTDAIDEFQDKIIDSAISAKLCGKTYQTCFRCTKFKMQTLFNKAQLLKCDFIASAHYAKVYKNHTSDEFFVYRSNDLAHDQSYKLSSVPKEILASLILPLAELKKEDVLKLAKQLELTVEEGQKSKKKLCVVNDVNFVEYINKFVPTSLHLKGKIEEYKTGKGLGEHSGLQNFEEGQQGLILKDSVGKEKYHVIDISESSRTVSLSLDAVKFNSFHLYDCEFAAELDRSKHLDLFIKIGFKEELHSCQLVFKNSQNCIIHLNESVGEILGNSLCVLYSSNKGTSRILGYGFIGVRGEIVKLDRIKEYREENDESNKTYGF